MDIQPHINPSIGTTSKMLDIESLNTDALRLSNRGDHAGAERLHKRALELKEGEGCGPKVVALTLNALGEVQLRQNKLTEAEENLRRAVAIRNSTGHAFDAAVSRENLAQVLEAKGEITEGREVRDQGKPDKLACGNYKCSGKTFRIDALQTCTQCRCIYYCSVACQKADWGPRHKRFCKKLN